MGIEWDCTSSILFTDCRKAYHSVRGAVLYNILSEIGMPIKLLRF
jgi:hypothetical protein